MHTILVVDDYQFSLSYSLKRLKKSFNIIFTENKDDAGLALALSTEKISLILIGPDLSPDEHAWSFDVTSGYFSPPASVWSLSLIKKLRSNGCTIPICMFNSSESMNEVGVRAGADYSFHKEYRNCNLETELIEYILSCLQK